MAGCIGDGDEQPTNTTEDDDSDGDEPTSDDQEPEEPPELPNIERRTVHRDRAAVTFISRELTGTAYTTNFRWVDLVDPSLLGTWGTDEEAIGFSDQRGFTWIIGEDEYNGVYSTDEELDSLLLQFNDGSEQPCTYEITTTSSEELLRLRVDGELIAEYPRVASISDDRDPVTVAQDTEIADPLDDGGVLVDELMARARGSGFIISPDGYIISNAHVVADESPEGTLLLRLADTIVQGIREGFADGGDLSQSEQERIEAIFFDRMWNHVSTETVINDIQTDISVLYGRASPSEDIEVHSLDAEIVRTGEFAAEEGEDEWVVGRDIALLSVDETDLPTVELADEANIETGEDVFVIGYPDIGVEEVFGERSTTLEPTLTRGVVSARRTLETGLTSIQTDAALNGGNSGGPMYNSDGEVVGIATFKAADPRIDEVSFGLPIEGAHSFMVEQNIENSTGETHSAFVEGLDAYWQGNCETATDRMENVLELSPDHPYAGEYIEDCEDGEAPGQ